ncbi:hypothetical protein B4Q13_21285, partial [Lacticaseibacillus rhamnosus]
MATARAAEVPVIHRSVHGFVLAGLSTVSRAAGTAVLIRYWADSQPDPVTGKVYKDAIERYEFYRNGTEAVVTLAGPADIISAFDVVVTSLLAVLRPVSLHAFAARPPVSGFSKPVGTSSMLSAAAGK